MYDENLRSMAMHAIAETEWHHSCVFIATKRVILWLMNSVSQDKNTPNVRKDKICLKTLLLIFECWHTVEKV